MKERVLGRRMHVSQLHRHSPRRTMLVLPGMSNALSRALETNRPNPITQHAAAPLQKVDGLQKP